MKKLKGVFVYLFITVLLATCGSAPTSTHVQTHSSTQTSVPELTEVSSYYVRADGNDSNAGTSENAPLKTLAKALEVAAKSQIKEITVIGTITISGNNTFINSGSEEIIIRGKPSAVENEKAVLKGFGTLLILQGNSNIKLEYITLQGETGPNNEGSRGIWVEQDATLTLGRDVIITHFSMGDHGTGVFLGGGTLFMTENAQISNNRGQIGGGLIIVRGNAIMRDKAAIINNISIDQREAGGGGGVAIVEYGSLTMKDSSFIAGNKAVRGGGIFINSGTLVMEDNVTIVNNISETRGEGQGGGGVTIRAYGTLTMKGSSSITGNKAVSGGGVFIHSGTLVMEDNTTIKNNEASTEKNILFGGGGIHILRQGEVILKDNSLVTENKASFGGGVYTRSEDLEFIGGIIGDSNSGDYEFQTGSIRGNFADRGIDVFEMFM